MQDNIYEETHKHTNEANLKNISDLMETEQLHQHFNIKALLEILSQDRKSMLNLIPIAQKSIPNMITSLKLACSSENREDIKAVLHTLRGSAQNMYFLRMAELSGFMESNLPILDSSAIEKCLNDINEEWLTLKEIFDALVLAAE